MIHIRLVNSGEIKNRLELIKKNQLTGYEKAMNTSALYLEKEIKASVARKRAEPKSWKTGNFFRSINGRLVKEKDKVNGIVSTNVEYAPYLEYGTSRGIRPRRHFRNSLARNRKKIVNYLAEEMKKNI